MKVTFRCCLDRNVIRMEQILYAMCRFFRRYDSDKSLTKRKSVPNQNSNKRCLVNDQI